jgi:hypothetical protein
MYNGYWESEEKIESRKRRILGQRPPLKLRQQKIQMRRQERTPDNRLKRQILTMVILYPAAFLIGNVLGKLVATLGR